MIITEGKFMNKLCTQQRQIHVMIKTDRKYLTNMVTMALLCKAFCGTTEGLLRRKCKSYRENCQCESFEGKGAQRLLEEHISNGRSHRIIIAQRLHGKGKKGKLLCHMC